MRFAAVKCTSAEKRGLRAPNKYKKGNIMESGRKKAVKITALVLVAVIIAAAVVLS